MIIINICNHLTQYSPLPSATGLDEIIVTQPYVNKPQQQQTLNIVLFDPFIYNSIFERIKNS